MRFFVTLAAALGLACAQGHAQEDRPDLFALIGAGDVEGFTAALDAGAAINVRQDTGLEATPLMWATGVDNPVFVDTLIAAGAEIDTRDAMGDPAINWAAYYGRLPAISALLDAGADTDLTGHGTPVEIVMRRGHQAALAILIDHRNERPDRHAAEAALEAAVMAGDTGTITALANYVDVASARDWAGRPVLQSAARAGQGEAVRALIEAGADPDARDRIGFTALHEAAREGRTGAVAALLAAGADPNARSEPSGLSLTPLHMAATANQVDALRLLLDAGADPDVTGTMGATPLLWATFEGAREAALALVEAGADTSIAGNFGDTARAVAEAREWDDVVAAIDAAEID
ncbi:ankyrin repeat domain-containing protein [Hyphobacterium marinum]|uniref:Ankyrin repeat domain-containing protein n=1 Tax=Hyphobacterium marinum TaxID=3116574 RepID=A0ABU7LWR1_9PROT|nr:ankyrin repeat domain-containing protein [Hyphobacterium sp. Y6023]MEE2565921.1 ankyrin repeat domain-containing protein [Hyphobacterium sp. Y6023]